MLLAKKEKDDIGFPTTADWVHDFGERLADIEWLCKFLTWIESKRNRSIKVHIDNYDVWGMDYTLSLIIVPMLDTLKEQKAGSPMTDDEDVPEELCSHKRWSWVMDEMIWSFTQIRDDGETQFYGKPWDDKWKKKREEYHERILNGTILFGKYYRGLWD